MAARASAGGFVTTSLLIFVPAALAVPLVSVSRVALIHQASALLVAAASEASITSVVFHLEVVAGMAVALSLAELAAESERPSNSQLA